MTNSISGSGFQPITTPTTTTTGATGSLGTSSVSTSAGANVTQTATTTSTVSTPIIQTSGESTISHLNNPTPTTVTVTTSSSSTEATATSTKTSNVVNHRASSSEDSPQTTSTESEASVSSDYQTAESGPDGIEDGGRSNTTEISKEAPKAGNTQGNSESSPLNQLQSQSYTIGGPRNENVISPGPEGLPNMSLPTYNPADKNSILSFLSNPNVKSKIVENSGHLVFIDTARSSFIFIPNGKWEQVCSMKVQNGKTKEDLDIKNLENMCAKFCTGFNKFSSDWSNRVDPLVSNKAGLVSGGNVPEKIIINNKFKTCVAYGPWNNREAGNDYTPSAWRRGHQVDFGKIFEQQNPFNKINWGASSDGNANDGISFSNETPGATMSDGYSSGPNQPIINVNVNVGGTNVSIGDTNVSTSGTGTTSSTDTSTDTNDLDSVDRDDSPLEETLVTSHEELPSNDDVAGPSEDATEIKETDYETDADSGIGEDLSDTDSTIDSNDGSPFTPDILKAVRKHLDTVYPGENGGSTDGVLHANQTLGNVINDMETKGSAQDTIVSSGDNAGSTEGVSESDSSNETSSTDDVSDTDSSVGEANNTSPGTDSSKIGSKNSTEGGDGGPSGPDILKAVRKHLDTVYPGENGGSTDGVLHANQTLGNVINDIETKGHAENTIVSSRYRSSFSGDGVNNTNLLSGLGKLLPTPPPKPTTTTPRTTNHAATSTLTSGRGGNTPSSGGGGGNQMPGGTLEELLPKLRAHLDQSFDKQGFLVSQNGGPNLGGLIKDFRARTGSGGIIAFIGNVPGRKEISTPLSSQGSGPTQADLYNAAQGVSMAMQDLLQEAGHQEGKITTTSNPVSMTASSSTVAGNRQDPARPLGQGGNKTNIFQSTLKTTQALGKLLENIE
ncbi:type III secretion system actin-recruiting effector Tarp [Chlamydia sp.]|uniref:type III secretion system actin-recruiting effector Tarp n=1 Tax=Chlamydia sp. TaxID=35827 RepID=UPI0025C41F79|nr:type III secretion system actin-recruiting effector Tarp [Chlamydia sp.]MBQ8498644.1 type III secretion system actin-recruiting effector Tarp [Chlamydia sp.]